jgi:hypothetical protein
MARYAEALVAVWQGNSPGTEHMIAVARARGLKVFVHEVTRKGAVGFIRQGNFALREAQAPLEIPPKYEAIFRVKYA